MAFPKGSKRVEDVAPDLIGHKLNEFVGVDLLLKDYILDETRTYGQVMRLRCERENGTEVEIYTFSKVVADQVMKLKDVMPVIIKPRQEADYFTLL